MAREIKFRAWDKNGKKMYEVFELNFTKYGYSCRCRGFVGKTLQAGGAKSRECELMQYTGLKDKNGKMIFEGDIIKVGKVNVKVFWRATRGSWAVKYWNIWKMTELKWLYKSLIWATKGEIIGNIYKNKDLIK